MKAELKAKKAEMLKTMAGIPDYSFKACLQRWCKSGSESMAAVDVK